MNTTRRESPLATWERNRAFHRARRSYGRHAKLAGIVRRAASRVARRHRGAA